MAISFLPVFAITLASANHAAQTTPPQEQDLQIGGISPDLTFVANVDGKSFYVDLGTGREDDSQLFKQIGKGLTSTETAGQFAALKYATLPEFSIGSGFWTTGRDLQEI